MAASNWLMAAASARLPPARLCTAGLERAEPVAQTANTTGRMHFRQVMHLSLHDSRRSAVAAAGHWTPAHRLSETTPHEKPAPGSRRRSRSPRAWPPSPRSARSQRASTRPIRRPAGRCRAPPDGKPDLQGVWGNNSVTPMTRPTQWKDKTTITDAEVDELKGFLAQVRRSGRRRDLRQLDSDRAQRERQGRVQADLVRPDDRQLQPVLDGRSRMGQPHVAHHRSA